MAVKCSVSEKCLSDVAICCIAVGIILTVTGLFWPVNPNYTLNMEASAEENEKNEADHARFMVAIYTVIVLGMVFVLIGALITSGLLMKVIITEECGKPKHKRSRKRQHPGVSEQQQIEIVSDMPMNSRSVSWGQYVQPSSHVMYTGARRGGEERLVESDQLEMNQYFSNMKPYGALQG
ncbi:unnamed protein product [Lymnaea stagnalis]|uniref:Uncharacterized protein n=1 Tax=Lymnaea stagnalis TaxID=6523 RepID=A0AAV2HXZ0_LYMST